MPINRPETGDQKPAVYQARLECAAARHGQIDYVSVTQLASTLALAS
jgi:hypothetical protein